MIPFSRFPAAAARGRSSAVVWTVGLFLAGVVPAQAGTVLQLEYEVSLAGLPAGEISATVTLGDAAYAIASHTRSVGVLDWIVGFDAKAKSHGALVGNDAVPAEHRADNVWQSEVRTVRLRYEAGVLADEQVLPSRDAEQREPIAAALRMAGRDPLTSFLQLALRTEAFGCGGAVAVFDGRRTFELTMGPGGPEEVSTGGYTGQALRCEVTYRRTGGQSKEPWIAGSHAPQTGAVWLARLAPGLPAAPVRMQADAGLGDVVLTLRTSRLCRDAACPVPAAAGG